LPIADLSHYLVRANDIELTKQFYIDALGFEVMPRPDLPFPGYWLGVQGRIQVHIAQHGVEQAGLYYIGSPPHAATDNSGVIDHIAFVATDPQAMAERLDKLRLPVRRRFMPESELYQLFVKDPNGVTVELNFFGISDVAGWMNDACENYSSMPRSHGGSQN
jgi:catechol 2,3-dioxygenase-like lactoylglutathione lyase family enzyme